MNAAPDPHGALPGAVGGAPDPHASPTIAVRFARTRRRLAERLSFAAKGGVALFVVAGASRFHTGSDVDVFVLTFILSLVGWLVFITAMLSSFIATQAPTWWHAELVEDDDTLAVSGRVQLRIEKKDVVSAIHVPRDAQGFGAVVELETRSGDFVEISLPSHADAAQLVTRLGFDTRAVAVDLASKKRRFLHVLLGAGVYQALNVLAAVLSTAFIVGGEVPNVVVALVALLEGAAVLGAYRWLKRRVSAPRVTVAADGVTVTKRGRRRFVGRASIARLEQLAPASPLDIVLHDGERVSLAGLGIDVERRVALGRLMHGKLAANAHAAADTTAAYVRGGQSVGDWRERLRGALDRGTYRDAGISVEAAARVVTSAEATPEERIGAALALRVAGAPADPIRVAASATAHAEAREALEAIADDEPDVDRKIRRAVEG